MCAVGVRKSCQRFIGSSLQRIERTPPAVSEQLVAAALIKAVGCAEFKSAVQINGKPKTAGGDGNKTEIQLIRKILLGVESL